MDPLSIALIAAGAGAAYDVAKQLVTSKTRMVKKRREAVSALSLAVTSTKSYVDYLLDGGARSHVQQQHLSRLWRDAYESIRPFFRHELQRIEPLRMKSKYWEDPDEWSEADVKRTRIALSRVQTELKKFIRTEK